MYSSTGVIVEYYGQLNCFHVKWLEQVALRNNKGEYGMLV